SSGLCGRDEAAPTYYPLLCEEMIYFGQTFVDADEDRIMLVAYGPNGRPVIAEETALVQLQQWSHERALHCPNCRSIVHVRGGPEKRTQLHFAHQKGECAWSTEVESVRHATGKIVLANWLRAQFPQASVTLEERLPEPNRIADVFVAHANGTRWAIEFQCAPLNIEEWRHRHTAYQAASILDIWIVGNNRREKQEAFIEAIIASASEILFLDPLVTPPHIWLRWPIARDTAQTWPQGNSRRPICEGWVGRVGYGATLRGQLHEVHFAEDGQLIHPVRAKLESQTLLLSSMANASSVDEVQLTAYLLPRISAEALHLVILPLLRSYLRDPNLLQRYNYGRGHFNEQVSEEDQLRVQKARRWLNSLAGQGFPGTTLQELAKELPYVGPYAAFARYIEILLTL
ncbi:MAG: hypothetical protein M3Z24_13830, partial [Chloroflexota bacterium]|nr:hypothetical protein [Chloroflexota bacterium]